MSFATFHDLISANKRNTWILILVFVLVFVGMGMLFGYLGGYYLGDPQAASHSGQHSSIQSDTGWRWGMVVAMAAGGLALVLALSSYYGGASALLSMSQAREIQKADDPKLFNVVEELAIAAGLPRPRIFLIDDSAMNAFATGRDPHHAAVAITTGLRAKLSRDELQGVMAHELSHVRNYDILYATLIAVMIGVLVLMCDAFLRSSRFWSTSRQRGRGRSGSGGGAGAILLVIALLLAIVAPILARIIQMAISRQREFLADAGSVQLTRNPQGLAAALTKLEGDTEVLEVANRATSPLYIIHPIKKFEERSNSIFSTHPPVRDRISRLMSLTT